MPPELALNLIADNYATLNHPAVKAWLAERNQQTQHYVWRVDCAGILEKITRLRSRLEGIMADTPRTVEKQPVPQAFLSVLSICPSRRPPVSAMPASLRLRSEISRLE